MKQNKIAIIVTVPIVVASLILALLLDIFVKQGGFWTNVFLGVFGSALLGLITAIINYITERKNTIDAFYMHHIKAVNNFHRFQKNEFSADLGEINTPIEMILRMAEFDYFSLDEAYKNMSFLFYNQKKRNQIFEQMYKPIVELREKVLSTALLIENFRMGKILTEERKKECIAMVDDCFEMAIAASIPLKEGKTVQLIHVIKKLHENEKEFYNTYMRPKKKEHK